MKSASIISIYFNILYFFFIRLSALIMDILSINRLTSFNNSIKQRKSGKKTACLSCRIF